MYLTREDGKAGQDSGEAVEDGNKNARSLVIVMERVVSAQGEEAALANAQAEVALSGGICSEFLFNQVPGTRSHGELSLPIQVYQNNRQM